MIPRYRVYRRARTISGRYVWVVEARSMIGWRHVATYATHAAAVRNAHDLAATP